MFPWSNFLADSVIFVTVFTAFIIGSIRWKPRLWLHDFPADIQARAIPKTDEEKRQTRLLAVALIPLMFVLPILLAGDLKALMGAEFSFGYAWLYGYGLFLAMNLWDLVIDWIGFSLIDPQKPPFPGTEGAAGWRNYAFHFHGFLKGSVIGLAFATYFAAVISLLT